MYYIRTRTVYLHTRGNAKFNKNTRGKGEGGGGESAEDIRATSHMATWTYTITRTHMEKK